MADVNSGLEGVLAAETTISLVDGSAGRLLYRGYEIGDLAAHGTFDSVTALLLDGEWPTAPERLPAAGLDEAVTAALRSLPAEAAPLDALRTGVSAWGAERGLDWPPTPAQARELIALAPAIVGGFARLREGREPVDPAGSERLGVAGRLLHAISGEAPEASRERALDAYFVCCAEHGLNASTFTARVVTSTHSDIASAVCGAVGALKGRLHGGAPSGVRDQLTQIGDVDHAERWIREALARGERLMGFGHRIYRTTDPRAEALRHVAEGLAPDAEWLRLAIDVEDVALRLLAEHKPDRALKTNVEYYASVVLDGVGLPSDLYTPAFAVARTAGWCAHVLEQAERGRLIRPDAAYIGPAARPLPH
ncbi:MAG TPA: citrate synthase [Gaiellales bacterium]|jgi:citrate synthase|nr:citrate synthase [Gaiellales bacterium]